MHGRTRRSTYLTILRRPLSEEVQSKRQGATNTADQVDHVRESSEGGGGPTGPTEVCVRIQPLVG